MFWFYVREWEFTFMLHIKQMKITKNEYKHEYINHIKTNANNKSKKKRKKRKKKNIMWNFNFLIYSILISLIYAVEISFFFRFVMSLPLRTNFSDLIYLYILFPFNYRIFNLVIEYSICFSIKNHLGYQDYLWIEIFLNCFFS